MSSIAQITANRTNSLASTGPRTDAGKAVSSRNAISHGLSSADPVLPHEDRSRFLALVERYLSDFGACTAHEEFLIEQMAAARWKLDRVQRIENILLEGMFDDPANPDAQLAKAFIDKDGDAFARLDRYRANLERAYHRSIREFRAARKFQYEPTLLAPEPKPFTQSTAPHRVSPLPAPPSAPEPGPRMPNTTKAVGYAETNPALRL